MFRVVIRLSCLRRPSFEAFSERPSPFVPSYIRPAFGASGKPGELVQNGTQAPQPQIVPAPAKRKRRLLRRFATFAISVSLFTGILYGTASYMRGRAFLPEIRNPFKAKTGTANTDIYLRPSPNTDNDPIGLVTKNSKVRIVNSQNNWYQVDVVQQGRDRTAQGNATRGWLNGKYLDISDN